VVQSASASADDKFVAAVAAGLLVVNVAGMGALARRRRLTPAGR
jgi:hypothetical protein